MTKTTDTLERDGKTWHWCPKHVIPGTYNGLYVTHKPEDHEEWKKRRDNWRAKTCNSTFNSKPKEEVEKQDGDNKKLALTDTLKAALLTRCDLMGAQADALIKEAQDDEDF